MAENVVLVIGSKGVGKSHVVSQVTGRSEVNEQKSELVSSFSWEISTKYYTAPLSFYEARVTTEWSHEALSKEYTAVENTKALIIVVDLYEKEPEALASKWSSFVEERDLDVALLVGNRGRARPDDAAVAKLGDANAERLQDFAHENYLEFVEVPFGDGNAAAPVDEVASMLRERVGTERIMEALACNHWFDMVLHSPRGRSGRGRAVSKQPTEKEAGDGSDAADATDSSTSSKKTNGVPSDVPSLLSKDETKAGQDAAKSSNDAERNSEEATLPGVTMPDQDLSAIFAGMNFADDLDAPPASELAAAADDDDDDGDEMFADFARFESVFEKMRAVRENAPHMSHEARRKLAEDTILEMCAYLNIDDESGDEGLVGDEVLLGGYEAILDGEGHDAIAEVDESTKPVVVTKDESTEPVVVTKDESTEPVLVTEDGSTEPVVVTKNESTEPVVDAKE